MWKHFRKQRKAAGLTQAQAAEKSGLGVTTVRRMESPDYESCSWRNLRDYAAAIGASLPRIVVESQSLPSAAEDIRVRSRPIEGFDGWWLVDWATVREVLSSQRLADCPSVRVSRDGKLLLQDVLMPCSGAAMFAISADDERALRGLLTDKLRQLSDRG